MDIGKYFSKKRDLSSNNSNDGEVAKKVREDVQGSASSDISICTDDVFATALESPNCKDILFMTLKKLDLQMKEIHALSQENKESNIKGECHLAGVAESISLMNEKFEDINKKFDNYEKERKEKEKEIKDLKEKVLILSNEKKDLEQIIDRQEQYSRRNCILIHGVKEEQNEDTDNVVVKLIKDNLEEDVDLTELDRSHRIGKKKSNGKARPIIVKFARYNVRRKVFYNKKKLKGKNISITESLTKFRMEKLQEARELYDRKNVWTYDGRIMFKVNDEVKIFYD